MKCSRVPLRLSRSVALDTGRTLVVS